MNLKEIREMINLMNENDLTEIEVEREGAKIKIKKGSEPGVGVPPVPVSYKVEPEPQAVETKPAPAAASGGGSSNRGEIQSPMVGTFYRSPSPDADPFVNVGDVVEVGQVVCIVEAMKLMNEIKSEVKGKIVETPVENAQPVEFGQALFYIEPV